MLHPFFKDFDDFFNSNWVSFVSTEQNPMDIVERDNEYEVKVVIPGVSKDDLSVSIDNGNLEIKAISKAKTNNEGDVFIIDSIREVSYSKSIPNIRKFGVDETKISSTYKNGILSIILPKAEEAKPKAIDITIE